MWKSFFSLCARRRTPSVPAWLDNISSLPDLHALAGRPISDADVPRFRELVEDLAFKKLTHPRGVSRIGYIPLIEDRLVTLCIFYLPRGTFLPFHDHPGQHVGLRVLSGQLAIEMCDIQLEGRPMIGNQYPVTHNEKLSLGSNSPVLIVRPSRNNIHEIRAEEDSMFLDVVVPPYSSSNYITYFEKVGHNLKAVRERDVDVSMDFIDFHSLISDRTR
jgi:hypothetical protein